MSRSPCGLSRLTRSWSLTAARHRIALQSCSRLRSISHRTSGDTSDLPPFSDTGEQRGHEEEAQCQEQWEPQQLRPLRKDSGKNTRDIVPGDLDATLEAHRVSNRPSPVRYYHLGEGGSDVKDEQKQQKLGSQTVTRLFRSTNNASAVASSPALDYAAAPKIMYEMPPKEFSARHYDTVSGRSRWSVSSEVTSPMSTRPWRPYYPNSASYRVTARQRLIQEAQAFVSFVSPTDEEAAEMAKLKRAVRHTVSQALPSSTVTFFGSRETGLADAWSDLDASVEYLAPSSKTSVFDKGSPLHLDDATRKGILRKLQTEFADSPRFKSARMTGHPVPVLSLLDTATNIKVQLVVDGRAPLRDDLVRQFLEEEPDLRTIYHLLRQALRMRGLLRNHDFSISSYPLFMLIVAAFRLSSQGAQGVHGRGSDMQDSIQQKDLVWKLMGVLRFIGKYMHERLDDRVFSIEPLGEYSKTLSRAEINDLLQSRSSEAGAARSLNGLWAICRRNIDRQTRPGRGKASSNGMLWRSWLCLQDPAVPDCDLGAGVSRIREIMGALRYCRSRTVQSLRAWDESAPSQRQLADRDLIDFFAFGNWQHFLDRRYAPSDREGEGESEVLRDRAEPSTFFQASKQELSRSAEEIRNLARKSDLGPAPNNEQVS